MSAAALVMALLRTVPVNIADASDEAEEYISRVIVINLIAYLSDS